MRILFPSSLLIICSATINVSAASENWDNGIDAWFTNYRLSANNSRAQYAWETSGTDGTLTLDNGLNLGAWRLRNQNTFWREQDGKTGQYSDHLNLWRSFTTLKSRLALGYGTSSGDIFDSITYQGVSLSSDEAMYPKKQRPYRPVITGYARTYAEVSIRQDGALVYRVKVPPGSFTITDFYPQDNQGDFELTVEESDGTERVRTLPYSTLPNLQQQGVVSYELVAGRYQPYHGISRDRPTFWQASATRGITRSASLFGGIQQGEHYISDAVGAGDNLGVWGALSADISSAAYTLEGDPHSGQVARLRYAKEFFATATSLNAQIQWYPQGSEYRSLEEQNNARYALRHGWDDNITQRAWQTHLELNENFDEDSSLSLSWDSMSARHNASGSDTLSLMLNGSWQDVDGSFYLSHNHDEDMPPQIEVGMTISIPFMVGSFTTSAGYVSRYSNRDSSSQGVDIYGSGLKDYSLTYDVSAQHTRHQNDALNASLGYLYNAGDTNLSMSRSGKQRNYHLDSSGSVLVSREGITLGQTLTETVALVSVAGTPGVSVYNQYGSTTDKQGNLLVSYLNPWRDNPITVNTFDIPPGLSFSQDEYIAAPSRGAIVRTAFKPDTSPSSMEGH